MDPGVQETQTGRAEGHAAESGDHPSARRRPAGRKPGPTPDYEDFGGQREAVIRHCFPELNHWLDNLPDARCQEMCVYLGRHIWWQMILTGLAERIHAEFPKLPICLLFDGLYPVQCVFDLCAKYEWKFIATLREGRQPTAWDEAVQTMMMNPGQILHAQRDGADGLVDQTFRWTQSIPFGQHEFSVLFCGEISPVAATLWVWVTNLQLDATQVYDIANDGGRARQGIENVFNVEKNGGFGLEHAFCADDTASQNYHLMMQVAYTLGQLLVNGLLRRLRRACRQVTDIKLIELLRTSLLTVRIDPNRNTFGQIRFCSSS